MTATTLATTTPAELTRADRCDSCGAQAYVRATIHTADGLSLLFCGHHFRDHELALLTSGATIHDERRRIDDEVSAPER
ncbi:DUF7455 domain-containing protein [Actinotalea subterranea]|uniref:DUF7455 domain-containing protein n=1 Tax=Actinotalea subterranea TaxID=2607497 RepID=UPI0011EBE8D9|nr:hypothetical protein [Actinotalea subterranea]